MVEVETQADRYAVYLLHADGDETWVEEHIASRLQDDENLRPHFRKWHSIPGTSMQKTMQDGFNKSDCCAVCLGKGGLGDLEQMMQEAATKRKAKVSDYRLIPVLLPGYDQEALPELLDTLFSIDLREEKDFDYQFYRLVCGINNKPPGPWHPKDKHGGSPPAGELSGVAPDKHTEAALKALNVLKTAVENGYPPEEADKLKTMALTNIINQITQGLDVSQVTVQGSRAEKP